jgi:hypothetical protein
MKTHILFIILLFASVINANAQLKVDSTGHVAIASSLSNFVPKLSVGDSPYYASSLNVSIAIAAKPNAIDHRNNIAIEGLVTADQNFTSERNYGVLGITSINSSHGYNYGVSGMISFNNLNSNSGGAGIYGTDYAYLYNYPDNLHGLYAAYFHGGVYLSGQTTALELYTPADDRLNENVGSMARNDEDGMRTLDNLLRMNVLEYNTKKHTQERTQEEISEMTDEMRASYEMMKKDEEKMASRLHFGLSAQELQEIYPDLVMEGQDGYLAINYIELVPLLIRSIQDLKQELDELKYEEGNKYKVPQTADVEALNTKSKCMFYQNTPNPFREMTVIRFKLSDDVKDASICIFDMSGKLLKKLPVSRGMESVSVSGYEMGEGMFLYSLVVNGREIDTKRMIITE